MSSAVLEHTWNAEDYHVNSSAQSEAATHLLQHIKIKGNEKILDVGCGDGKITAEIAKKIPQGSVIGIDRSFEMIDFAQKSFPKNLHTNLTFFLQDAQKFNHHSTVDILFSSFALQWVKDLNLFLKCAHESLTPSGHIVATIPLNISTELEKAIDIVITSSIWEPYFQNFDPGWEFKSEKTYRDLLTKQNFFVTYSSVETQERIFDSRKSFEKYVLQWFSYLSAVPTELKDLFFRQVIEQYLLLSPLNKKGEVSFRFDRVDLIARKINP